MTVSTLAPQVSRGVAKVCESMQLGHRVGRPDPFLCRIPKPCLVFLNLVPSQISTLGYQLSCVPRVLSLANEQSSYDASWHHLFTLCSNGRQEYFMDPTGLQYLHLESCAFITSYLHGWSSIKVFCFFFFFLLILDLYYSDHEKRFFFLIFGKLRCIFGALCFSIMCDV